MKKSVFSSHKIGFHVDSPTWNKILSYYQHTYGGVIPETFPMEDFARQRLESAQDQLARLQSLKIPKKKKFLDAGCGIGSFMVTALKNGYNYYGYEVDKKAFAITQDLLRQNNLDVRRVKLYKNDIPFSNSFDYITSFEVAEHVTNLPMYIHQIAKKLSADGKIFIETPNYLLPYEPHFYVFLPPFLPKSVTWLFCVLKGRKNRTFFNELNFVTPMKFAKAFKQAGLVWQNIGQKEWYQQLAVHPAKNRSTYVKRLSKLLQRTGLKKIILYTAKMGIYTPQIYIAYFPKKHEH